jgi:hypothetical protein
LLLLSPLPLPLLLPSLQPPGFRLLQFLAAENRRRSNIHETKQGASPRTFLFRVAAACVAAAAFAFSYHLGLCCCTTPIFASPPLKQKEEALLNSHRKTNENGKHRTKANRLQADGAAGEAKSSRAMTTVDCDGIATLQPEGLQCRLPIIGKVP